MSEAKFTKGEWFVVETASETTVSCEDCDIATIWVNNYDAHLIACAPEMYEILENLSTYINEDGLVTSGLSSEMVKIRRVLAKARGEL